jgi:hypothetical protein
MKHEHPSYNNPAAHPFTLPPPSTREVQPAASNLPQEQYRQDAHLTESK